MELWIFSWYSMRIIVFFWNYEWEIMRTLLRFASLIMQFTPFSINLWWPFFPQKTVCFTKKQSHTVYNVAICHTHPYLDAWFLWHGVFIVIAVSASETSRDFPTLLICERLHAKKNNCASGTGLPGHMAACRFFHMFRFPKTPQRNFHVISVCFWLTIHFC